MDTLMLVVTVAALLVAAVSTTIAWRVSRAERQRRAARVAALAAAAGVPQMTNTHSRPWDPPINAEPAQADAAAAATPNGLFRDGVGDSGSGSRQRLLMGGAAALASVVVAVAGMWLFGGRASGSEQSAPRVPLELVTLSDARADGVLAVTGLIRNPQAGAAVRALEADVRVFDAAGIMIATKSGLVDVVDLGPGQESAFTLALGEVATAARYRVSFSAAGTILPHVDRRVNTPSAVSKTADAR